jgi:hypothetical protein
MSEAQRKYQGKIFVIAEKFLLTSIWRSCSPVGCFCEEIIMRSLTAERLEQKEEGKEGKRKREREKKKREREKRRRCLVSL